MSNCPACQSVNPAGARLCSKCGAALSQAQLRFIGREQELAALEAAALRTKSGGRGELLLVTGDAGVGKTWLCREFGWRCLADGMSFTASACQPSAHAIPLWPIRWLLRAKLGITAGMPAADVRRLARAAFGARVSPDAAMLPRWLEFLDAAEDSVTLQPQGPGVRRRLLELVAAVLLASEQGQVLLLEDLQWADPASLEFLQNLARHIGGGTAGGPTVLLLTHRREMTDAGARTVRALAAARLELGEFAGAELQRLTGAWLGGHPSLRELVRRVQERTGGNPFFVQQAVLDLEQGATLRGGRGAYELASPGGDWQLPDTVQALLATRMERLPVEQKNLLQTVAVVGQDCTLPMLCELTGAALRDVMQRAQALEAGGFLQHAGGDVGGNEAARRSTALVPAAAYGPFEPSHALVREVACQTLSGSRRQTLHARVADWLERSFPQTSPPCEQWISIAQHWEKSGQWARAGAWNLAAVQWAARWDLNLMLEQARAAVVNLDRGGAVPETAEKRIAARAALIRVAEHTPVPGHEVEQAYLEGRDLAKSSRDAEGHSQLLLSYGVHCLHRGDADFAAERAEQAARLVLAAASDAGAAGRRRDADESFTDYVLHIHNTAGRLQEGLTLAGELAGRDWMTAPMSARNYLARAEHAMALTYLGRLQQARTELDAVLGFAAADDNTAAWVHGFLVDHAVLSGDTTQALEHGRCAIRHAEAFGSPQYRAWAVRALGAAQCLVGQHAEAVAPLEQARKLFAGDSSGHIFEGVYLATLAESYRGSGHPKKAAEAAEAGIAAARRACARIQELQAWTVFLSLPRDGQWASRVPLGLTRMQELITFTGASAFLPWWCQSQARWAPDIKARHHWQRQTVDAFTRMGATPHVNRLTQTG